MTEPAQIDIRLADPTAFASTALVQAMEAEIEATYADTPGSIHSVGAGPGVLTPPAGAFLVVYQGERPVGCGGLKRLGERTCEIKRMYILPEARGRGLAERLLGALEEQSRGLGYSVARLDTGNRQPAAKHLYERNGYREIPDYNGNTQASFWFEKDL